MTNNPKHPLSPHLQVYRLPLTALISISHRASGTVLSVGAVLLVLLLAAAANSAECYQAVHAHLLTWYGKLFLMGFSFALYFHLCNGVRHFFWDIGWGFELDTADLTAKLVIVGAILLTAITWLIALNAG